MCPNCHTSNCLYVQTATSKWLRPKMISRRLFTRAEATALSLRICNRASYDRRNAQESKIITEITERGAKKKTKRVLIPERYFGVAQFRVDLGSDSLQKKKKKRRERFE